MTSLVEELNRRAQAASSRGDFDLFDLLDITARRLEWTERRLIGERVNADRLAAALNSLDTTGAARALRLHQERRGSAA
ncbi:hypothetical protein UFOVP209_8 [uncultured Caudovirales phage]|uniref:Uncharacterized protein n=1 Tax=uncultured Caudovirales phage TaxID=2100421 RepID=A0A6J7WLQ1_9CAUD|nr:hypothetical protein UFOVP209_8 [uncultured Caudovirales phage]